MIEDEPLVVDIDQIKWRESKAEPCQNKSDSLTERRSLSAQPSGYSR